MSKRALTLQIVGVTVVALRLIVFWVFDPVMTAIFMMSHAGATDAELIRQVWHFCLVPPEWVRPPHQWEKWQILEVYARFSVVVVGWALSVAALVKRHLRGNQSHLTKRWSGPPAGACSYFR